MAVWVYHPRHELLDIYSLGNRRPIPSAGDLKRSRFRFVLSAFGLDQGIDNAGSRHQPRRRPRFTKWRDRGHLGSACEQRQRHQELRGSALV